MLAKTYLSIARYPGEITENKKISAECSRVYRKACELLEPKVEIVKVRCGDKEITCHYRCPKGAKKTAAVLIMCGADMFKEDRGWASQHAIDKWFSIACHGWARHRRKSSFHGSQSQYQLGWQLSTTLHLDLKLMKIR